MSSLWTPSGEHRPRRASRWATWRRRAAGRRRARSARRDRRRSRQLLRVPGPSSRRPRRRHRRQPRHRPPAAGGAAPHPDPRTAHRAPLDEAGLAIDALAALVDGLGDRLGHTTRRCATRWPSSGSRSSQVSRRAGRVRRRRRERIASAHDLADRALRADRRHPDRGARRRRRLDRLAVRARASTPARASPPCSATTDTAAGCIAPGAGRASHPPAVPRRHARARDRVRHARGHRPRHRLHAGARPERRPRPLVEGVRGTVPMRMEPRRSASTTARSSRGCATSTASCVAVGGPDALCLRTPVALEGDGIRHVAEFTSTRASGCRSCSPWYPSHEKSRTRADRRRAAIARTDRRGGSDWSERVDLRRRVARRGAALGASRSRRSRTRRPAASSPRPTTSLPEWIGGVRNWDYRYCWLRDATFTLYALMSAGLPRRGDARGATGCCARSPASPRTCRSCTAPPASGASPSSSSTGCPATRARAPVRVGNAASEQFQLDVYGEVLDALHQTPAGRASPNGRRRTGLDAGRCSSSSRTAGSEPDEGIWEVRGPRSTSRTRRSWRGSRSTARCKARRAVPSTARRPVDRWRQLRDEIHARGVRARASTPTATRSRSPTARRRSTRAC